MIEKHHDRIVNIHLKEWKKNNGRNMPFGRGDTPVKEVLLLLRDRKYRIANYRNAEAKVASSLPAARLDLAEVMY